MKGIFWGMGFGSYILINWASLLRRGDNIMSDDDDHDDCILSSL